MDTDHQADEAWVLNVQRKLYQWSKAMTVARIRSIGEQRFDGASSSPRSVNQGRSDP